MSETFQSLKNDRSQQVTRADYGDGSETQQDCLLSIILPCRDEEDTVGRTIDWCLEGLERAEVTGEVLIIDSSNDASASIALKHGARVLNTRPMGVGRAYLDAIPEIRGRWVLMGDSDMTYDFRNIQEFVERLDQGYEFVMGTRTRGYIEPKSMPKLHRYFGSPVTTWIFNRLFGTRFTDIHCGMRAVTKAALVKMNIQSNGWEYASEMILKASLMKMQSCEVPVRFYKAPQTRSSHLVRAGWTAPWRAGWATLRIQFSYAPDFFLWAPGWLAFVSGLILLLPLAFGPVTVGSIRFDLHWELVAIMLVVLGYSAIQLATLARVHYNYRPSFATKVQKIVSFNRGIACSVALVCLGLIPNVVLAVSWISEGFQLSEISHSAVAGLALMILGFQTFGFTLLLNLVRD